MKEELKNKQEHLLEEIVQVDENKKIDSKEIEQRREMNVKNYLEGFDKEFESNAAEKINKTPLMVRLYKDFIQEIYQPSKRYKLALKIKNEINADMEKTFTKEQKEIMKQFKECESILIDDLIEQAFIYGYAMCNQLKEESIKQYPLNNNE